jgi:thymidylate synthase
MFRVFEGRTANDVWKKAASAFCKGGGAEQASRAGETRELLHSAMSISDPSQRWVTSRFPPINPAFAIAEIIWIIMGRNDSAFLNYFNRQLPKFAGHSENFHGAYGYRLRRHLGIDQIERAYQVLKHKPQSRQVVLQIWDGRIDLPSDIGEEADPDVPCNVVSILKVRRGRLEWMQILRSNDLYRGLPYNLVQFTTLQEVLAGWLDVRLGEYNQISNSLHVYASDMEYINKFASEEPGEEVRNTDSLAFPKEESERWFRELADQVQFIVNEGVSVDTLMLNLRRFNGPEAFRNMLCVVSAEGTRRRGSVDIAQEIMAECTNPIYNLLFDRWLERINRNPKSILKENEMAVA